MHFADFEADVGIESTIRCCFRKVDNFLMVVVILSSSFSFKIAQLDSFLTICTQINYM